MKSARSKSSMAIFISAAVALFALSLIAASREDDLKMGNGAGPGAFSTSAVGYAGLFDVMRGTDMPVAASTRNPSRETGYRGTLIAAEPVMEIALAGGAARGLSEAKRLLLVLPKWRWKQDPDRLKWISGMTPAPASEAMAALSLVDMGGSRVVQKDMPARWAVNEFPLSPFVDGTVQMLRPASGMKTLVGDGEDALLCEFKDGDRTVWILSDPDVMANHGLWRGQNADFMVSVIKSLSEEGNDGYRGRRAIIFDETLHGYRASADSIIRMMLSFPYAIVTILACVSALLLAASAAGRFGAPAEARPALDFGKALLIDNSARLLDYGGHHSVTLARYVRMTLSDAARAMHAPDGMSERELAEWAERVGNARKASVSCASIFRTVDGAGRRGTDALTTAARMAHKWKGEILNGYSVRSERHRHDKK